MSGRQVVVTGGTSGIGRATALALAAAGADVCIVGRELGRTEAAASEIALAARRLSEGPATGGGRAPGDLWAAVGDMGSLSDVTGLAEAVRNRTDRLDALVHAAGLLTPSYRSSRGGSELTVAVHVIGPHLLTAELAPLLAVGAPSTVVFVSSGGMYLERLDVETLEMPAASYRGTVAYARAKRAQLGLAHLWSAALAPFGVSAVAMHPGWVDTGALQEALPRFARLAKPLLRSAPEGADTVAWLASGAAGRRPSPGFWLDRRPRREHRWPGTTDRPGELERLWRWCEEKTGGAGELALAELSGAEHSPGTGEEK